MSNEKEKSDQSKKSSTGNTANSGEVSKEQSSLIASALHVAIPDDVEAKTLTLPDFVEPDSIPIGGVFVGKILEVVGDFTGDPDMVDCKNIIFQLPGQTKKIMFPMTGELGQALLRIPNSGAGLSNKVIAMKRREDRISKRFGNRQFAFEYVKLLTGAKVEAMFPQIIEK